MYVWICKKEKKKKKGNLSCNLTCYNVQYVCIVFDGGTFMQNETLVVRIYIFDPSLFLCAIPDPSHMLIQLPCPCLS